jgi:hypothetical protein
VRWYLSVPGNIYTQTGEPRHKPETFELSRASESPGWLIKILIPPRHLKTKWDNWYLSVASQVMPWDQLTLYLKLYKAQYGNH